MKQLSAKHATIEFIMQTSLLANIFVSLFYTLPWRTLHSVTFARYYHFLICELKNNCSIDSYRIVLIIILQERRALLFCQQDRALLCRECDIPIHKTNEHTQKHSRFLLTGVKLSASSYAHQTSSSSSVSVSKTTAGSTKNAKSESIGASSVNDPYYFMPNSTVKTSDSTSNHFSVEIESHCTNQEGSVCTSSISEYLMETLPGWHVEDFLDPSSSSPYGLCKVFHYFWFFIFFHF